MRCSEASSKTISQHPGVLKTPIVPRGERAAGAYSTIRELQPEPFLPSLKARIDGLTFVKPIIEYHRELVMINSNDKSRGKGGESERARYSELFTNRTSVDYAPNVIPNVRTGREERDEKDTRNRANRMYSIAALGLYAVTIDVSGYADAPYSCVHPGTIN